MLLKKIYVILFLVITNFISSCLAMKSPIDDYLNEGGKALNATFKNEASYLQWMGVEENNKKPKIVIVGSGRRTVSRVENYANIAYPNREYEYLLVNYTKNQEGEKTYPDIDLDVKEIGRLKSDTYDYCVFENVDFPVSFSKKAIAGAMRILKSGGKLITSNYPMFHPFCSKELLNNIHKQFPSCFDLSNGYSIVFNEKTDEICPYFSSKDTENTEFRLNELKFLNNNAKRFIKFFDIQNECTNITFTDIEPPHYLWPSISEKRKKSTLKKSFKSVLIFTKK